ncbi:MAG TPA: hypothetical protein VFV99_22450, partial [Kofleriaceae bacterium]|nr:hypothetical protein [Kofleriaceae bacterium]
VPMRDEQVRRYARHLMLPDVGGLGQTALMVASAKLVMRESEPDAELVAGRYLAAGGVGALVAPTASDEQRADLAAHGADTKVLGDGDGREVALAPRPAWWPSTDGDATALAFWRGGAAATLWMADIVNR